MSIYGPEELKHANRCLYSFNIVDGDEFEIDLKPPPILHSASENQFQHTTSQYHVNCCQDNITKPLAIRQRKISDNASSAEKKTKPISFFSGHLVRSSSKKNNPSIDDFSSLPTNLNKKNKIITEKKNESNNSNNNKTVAQTDMVLFTAGPEINEDITS
jgi:hypothetical protein